MRCPSGTRRLGGFGLGKLLAGLGIVLGAGVGGAEQAQHVITFDQVAVHGLGGVVNAPEVAHLDQPAGPSSSSLERPARPPELEPELTRGPVSGSPFAPGGGSNPSFVQEGFLVEAFWAIRMGTAEAGFKRAHFHPPDLSSGFEAQHFGNPQELHGIYIRSVDGRPFSLKSLRYRATRNRQLPRRPLSIEGFSNYDVNVLVGTAFDPRRPIRTQFMSFPVGLPVGSDVTLPWWTLLISGFETVQQVFIASTASVDFDNIVLTR
jgi:hypothetical protein